MLFAQTSSNQIMFLANMSGYLSRGPRLFSDRILLSAFCSQGRLHRPQACLPGPPMSLVSQLRGTRWEEASCGGSSPRGQVGDGQFPFEVQTH